MSYYVQRHNDHDGRRGWTGPIRSKKQADREVAAWEWAGWEAIAVESTPEVRAAVRAWTKGRRP